MCLGVFWRGTLCSQRSSCCKTGFALNWNLLLHYGVTTRRLFLQSPLFDQGQQEPQIGRQLADRDTGVPVNIWAGRSLELGRHFRNYHLMGEHLGDA